MTATTVHARWPEFLLFELLTLGIKVNGNNERLIRLENKVDNIEYKVSNLDTRVDNIDTKLDKLLNGKT